MINQGLVNLNATRNNNTYYKNVTDIFNLCSRVNSSADIDNLIDVLTNGIGTMAMVNYPYASNFVANLPANPVKLGCQNAKFLNATDFLSNITALA